VLRLHLPPRSRWWVCGIHEFAAALRRQRLEKSCSSAIRTDDDERVRKARTSAHPRHEVVRNDARLTKGIVLGQALDARSACACRFSGCGRVGGGSRSKSAIEKRFSLPRLPTPLKSSSHRTARDERVIWLKTRWMPRLRSISSKMGSWRCARSVHNRVEDGRSRPGPRGDRAASFSSAPDLEGYGVFDLM